MSHEIETLAAFAASTCWEDIPENVHRQAKLVLLDTIGVILAGSVRPEVRELRERLAATAGRGATLYAHGGGETDPRSAALLNGIAGRAIELCEGLRLVSGQAAMQVLPGVLALAEHDSRSGREMIATFVIGYELAGRLCSAITPRPLAHQNGQASLIAAAGAGARMRGLDAAGVSRAMRIATTLVLTPSYANAVAGATTLNVAGGMSGFVGALAPDLALAGFEAQPDAIEEAFGKLVADGFKTEGLTEALGTRWAITQNYFRLYACCNPIHPALDCVKAALRELKPQPEEIEHIDIATYRFASVMRNPDPPNYFASKYSLPHAAAVMAVRGKADYASIDDSALVDPRISALRQRVRIVEDVKMSAVAPRLRPARVTIALKDGRRATHACESHRGDFNEPFEESELRDKFRDLACEVLTRDGAVEVERAIDRCDDWRDIDELTDLIRRHNRA